jgi:hypothetical protein
LFYDIGIIDENKGSVIMKEGKYEHGAACIGYCTYEKKLHFIVCQWGEFYLHPSEDLAKSALQIQKRTPESFIKLNPSKLWIEKEAFSEQLRNTWYLKWLDAYELLDSMSATALKIKKAKPSTSELILGQCIFDIHPETVTLTRHLITDLDKAILELETYVNEHKSKSKSKHKEQLTQLISTLKQNKEHFADPEQREAAISTCLNCIDNAEEQGTFAHETHLFLRIMAKISLSLAIIATLGLAALIKQEYSYQTTGRHTLFNDITITHGKVDKVREVLQEHSPTHFGTASIDM